MFIPTTPQELKPLGWSALDVILVTGDTYIDAPCTGVAVIGKLLIQRGYRVGIIAQPALDSDIDISRLGEPTLFWGVTSGAVDSMVSNYTALKKRRKSDDYTPGGLNDRRPDRAVIAYSNLVRRHFKNTVPIVLGGIEASLRRICHYDYWSNTIRRSILFDAKADYLVYGMGEKTILSLAALLNLKANPHALKTKTAPSEVIEALLSIRGLCHILKDPPTGYLTLPAYEEISKKSEVHLGRFKECFLTFYENNDPLTAKGLVQKQDSRYLIHNPPAFVPDTPELDRIAALDFERDIHPFYKVQGKVKALDTIQFSIATHRGCYGECHFCAIAVHEGRTVSWRSEISILEEVNRFTKHSDFKGIITDVGGPTANMYGYECDKKLERGACSHKRCIFPTVCSRLQPDHAPHGRLLEKIKAVEGVRRVFVASGIRPDLIFADQKSGEHYIEKITEHHVSGQMKLAPEHTEPHLLHLMGKPGLDDLMAFKKRFDAVSRKVGKKQFLTYYFIAAHPGCTARDMEKTAAFAKRELKLKPEQVQIFTPTPSTLSTLMYYTEKPFDKDEALFVEKDLHRKKIQKEMLTAPFAESNEGETKRSDSVSSHRFLRKDAKGKKRATHPLRRKSKRRKGKRQE